MKRSELEHKIYSLLNDNSTYFYRDAGPLHLSRLIMELMDKEGMLPPSTEETKRLSALYYGYESFRELQLDQGTDEASIEFNYYEPESQEVPSGSHYEGSF